MFSLKLFTETDNKMVAHANPVTNECITFGEFSSCTLDSSDTRNSKLRVLVSDLKEGESRRYGCTASSFGSFGESFSATWSVTVHRASKYNTKEKNECVCPVFTGMVIQCDVV